MLNLNNTWIECECSNCSYLNEIQLVDVKTEKVIICNNCKISIQLIDNEASVNNSIYKFNATINEFGKMFKNFGK